MFARANRLDRVVFTSAYKQGKKAHTPGLLLIYLSAPTLKAAAVVGKKVSKGAVARHLLKRRLYAIFREAKIPRGHVIAVAKPPAGAYSFAQLRTEIAEALARLGVDSDLR